MAIAVVDTASGTAGGASSVTSSAVTISGTNRYLLVAVGFSNSNLETISSVVLDPGGANQTALTLIPNTAIASDNDGRVAFYGVANPPTGDLTVRVTFSASLRATSEALIYVWALTGVDQTTPVRAADTDAGQDVTSLSLSLATQVGDEAFSICYVEGLEEDQLVLTLTGGTKTEVVGGYDGIGVTNVTASSTTTAFTWNITNDRADSASAAVALAPAAEEPVEVSGSGTATTPTVAASGTGTVLISGSGSADIPPAEAIGSGSVDVAGTGEGTLPAVAGSGSDAVLVDGSGEAALPGIVAEGVGVVVDTGITGSGEVEAQASASASGQRDTFGAAKAQAKATGKARGRGMHFVPDHKVPLPNPNLTSGIPHKPMEVRSALRFGRQPRPLRR